MMMDDPEQLKEFGGHLLKTQPGLGDPTHFDIMPGNEYVLVRHPVPPPATYKMDLAGVESFLKILGDCRAGLLPSVAESWQAGTRLEGVSRNPRFMIETESLAGDVIFHWRDVRFGWRHYVMNRDEARRLAEEILRRCDQPPPPTAGTA
jgi:hypothetical protein